MQVQYHIVQGEQLEQQESSSFIQRQKMTTLLYWLIGDDLHRLEIDNSEVGFLIKLDDSADCHVDENGMCSIICFQDSDKRLYHKRLLNKKTLNIIPDFKFRYFDTQESFISPGFTRCAIWKGAYSNALYTECVAQKFLSKQSK